MTVSTTSKDKTTTTRRNRTAKPAAKLAAKPIAEPAAKSAWRREYIAIELIKGSEASKSQISNRWSNEAERDYRDRMLLGLWDFERPGSEPRLFWDGQEYHTGDGHHTAGAIRAVIETINSGLPGSNEAIQARLDSGTVDLPLKIPCYVRDGSAVDAKTYSLREANRCNGMRLSNEQKQRAIKDLITDREQLQQVTRWICAKSGKDFDQLSAAIPADRAIAAWLGNVSAPTVGEVWEKCLKRIDVGDQWPWLLADKRLGLDGKQQKQKRDKPATSPAAAATAAKPAAVVTDESDKPTVDPIGRDAVDRQGNGVSSSDPAPTDGASMGPVIRYTGKARCARLREIAAERAKEITAQVLLEIDDYKGATEVASSIEIVLKDELEYFLTHHA